MKLTQEFVLRNIAGDHILIPVVGLEDNFHGIITLNETGAFIWEKIAAGLEENEIVQALEAEYEVNREQAVQDVASICGNFRELGILE